MTKEIIKENIEAVKFKTWQDQIRIKVQEAKESALVKISIIREGFRNG
ncbi:MAG: hypothetical protein PHQ32_02525 [Firmicutes bacterium]|nr:hypothetical protein [Bacillota bacterium]